MQLSASQYRWLQWLQDHGGIGYAEGQSLKAGNDHANSASAMTFLHLIAKGTIEVRNGGFAITDLGKRCLTP